MAWIMYLFSLLGLGSWLYFRARRQRYNLPPGPPRDPILGNLRIMPTEQAPFVFHEWSKKYGDVMYLEVFGKPMVVLDTHEAAVDLLEKKGSIYSDRPEFPVYDILGWTEYYVLTFMRYGKQLAKHRQVYQTFLSRSRCEEYKLMQAEAALELARDLIKSPQGQHHMSISKFSTRIIVQMVTGHQIVSFDDPYLHFSHMNNEAFAETGPPGGTPIDFFPFLQYFPDWFPGSYYAQVARKWRPAIRKLFEYSVENVKREREAAQAAPSLILSKLEEIEAGASALAGKEELKGIAATLFVAGEATTGGTVTVFILAMVLYPECQKKAQAEIDSVIGSSRLPTFEDRENLPYVECICRETLRWNPAVPLGVPHRSTQEDVYRGMYIPKGSLVFSNIRAMSMNENLYHNPRSFIPERYLPQPAGSGEPQFLSSFGFGRRICPGQYLADNSVWIAIASILATCTISNAMDKEGNIIVPENIMTDGLDGHPKEFLCTVKTCSSASHALLNLAKN
ncbi:cytochrome P450 [Mycena rebaudengoi]|nr:cytochrome P450 [Mycena rebaudengoi]